MENSRLGPGVPAIPLHRIAPGPNTRGTYVALFRDPATVTALKNGDPVLREYLESAGFGWNVSGQRLPKGTCRIEDEGAHTDILQRLSTNMGRFDLKRFEINLSHNLISERPQHP